MGNPMTTHPSVDEGVRDVLFNALSNGRYLNEAASSAEEIIAALSAAGYVIEQGWKTIESAPKDGTPLLARMLWYPHGLHGREEYAEVSVDIIRWTTFNGGGWVHYDLGTPTHWRPAPVLPSSRPFRIPGAEQ